MAGPGRPGPHLVGVPRSDCSPASRPRVSARGRTSGPPPRCPPPPGTTDDPHQWERDTLRLATVLEIRPRFSPTEQARARTVAARDQRIQIGIDNPDDGLTQTLAAGPELLRRWSTAEADAPYAWAVITAAVDAARLGVRTPLTTDLLRAAAPDYCTPRQKATAPANWFEDALTYATTPLHGTTALRDHLTHPDDLHAITTGALDRRLYTIVIPLLRSRADAGDPEAAYQLAELLAVAGDRDELRARANAGDGYAAYRLARMLAAAGDDRLHRFGFDVHGEIADGPAW